MISPIRTVLQECLAPNKPVDLIDGESMPLKIWRAQKQADDYAMNSSEAADGLSYAATLALIMVSIVDPEAEHLFDFEAFNSEWLREPTFRSYVDELMTGWISASNRRSTLEHADLVDVLVSTDEAAEYESRREVWRRSRGGFRDS